MDTINRPIENGDSDDCMSDLRDEYGSQFISELTSNFVRLMTSELLPAADLTRAIDAVRAENRHPLTIEMELALYQVLVARCREIMQAQQQAITLGEELSAWRKHEVTLLEKMNVYLKSVPTKNARKGAAAKNEKLEPVRQFALRMAQEGSYPSRRQATLAIKSKVIEFAKTLGGISLSEQQAETTIDGWLKNLGYAPSAGKRGTNARKQDTSASDQGPSAG